MSEKNRINKNQGKNDDFWEGDFEEESFQEELRKLTADTPIPPSLLPEEIEKKLAGRSRRKPLVFPKRFLAMAASICLCVTAVATGVHMLNRGQDGILNETETVDQDDQSQLQASKEMLATATDYDQVYGYIRAAADERKQQYWRFIDGGISGSEGRAEESFNEIAQDTDGTGTGDSMSRKEDGSSYSDTNVRHKGVAEGDVTKTDGKYIYIIDGERGKLHIVDIRGGAMKSVAVIEDKENAFMQELYVEGNRMVVVSRKYEPFEESETKVEPLEEPLAQSGVGTTTTSRKLACCMGYSLTLVETYDITNPESPKLLESMEQSGDYSTMRVKDGYAYIISRYYPFVGAARENVGDYVPAVSGKTIDAGCIYVPQKETGEEYTVISTFPLENPKDTDSKAVLGTSGMCYVSEESIYITEWVWGETADMTDIRKISYENGVLTGEAQGKVKGVLDDSFSIDEYEGNLRLVTTVTESDQDIVTQGAVTEDEAPRVTNSLYILDEDLKITGKIENLAEGEEIYSARFMGNIGYFVTFRQTDPLFSADLSNPSSPKIIGELKIPGFSEYLHPYGEGRLLGIGMDVDEEGVLTEGVKLSMFDISDPGDVSEINKLTLENLYGTVVGDDYRAAFVDVEKNLFGFTAYGNNSEYFVFRYDEGTGFQKVFQEMVSGWFARAMYVEDSFYLISGNTIVKYSLDGFEKSDDIVL